MAIQLSELIDALLGVYEDEGDMDCEVELGNEKEELRHVYMSKHNNKTKLVLDSKFGGEYHG